MIRFVLSNRFVVGVLVAAVLAAIFPQGAAPGSWLAPQWTTKIGVFIIFLMQGMILPTEQLAPGLGRWKVHLFTQTFIFGIMPLLAWLLAWPFAELMGPALTFGWVFLGIIPCTISTSVVYATKSGGSAIVALFNTSFANVAGIFFVPLFWAGWTGGEGNASALGPMLREIGGLLLLPLVIGLVLRPCLWAFIERHKQWPGRISPCIIYFIIYVAFSSAVLNRFWENQPPFTLAFAVGGALVYAAVAWPLCAVLLKALRFQREDAVAAFFCGTQKTVAAGVPLAQSLLAHGPYESGVVLLPLLFYSMIQLAVGGLIVGRLERGKA